ncbi:hypothetical protein vBPpSSYP_51 [Pseudomonas phage vB_PpS_SYP]|nr:hypothetical protein vBPpSSYP_51 [Pseudomonas phage vB_PpS_SYP]
MSIKVRCTTHFDECVTYGNIYIADKIDDDGDAWIQSDDVGDEYLLFSSEFELVEDEK